MTEEWDDTRKKLSILSGIPEYILEILSIYDLIKYTAEGFSVTGLHNRLEIDKSEIRSVLREYFDFDGFSTDFPFDGRDLYIRNRFNQYRFVQRCSELDKTHSKGDFEKLFEINKKLDQIEKELFLYYVN